MSVADAASVRTVAVKLRALCTDTENQPIIARDEGCLRALISLVDPRDIPVATIAVAAINLLASHPHNFQLLRSEHSLLDALKTLLLSDNADRPLRQAIFDVLEELVDEQDDQEMDELDEMERAAGLTSPATTFDPALLDTPVTLRLHIPGISDDVLAVRVEQLVVRKHGVISVAFEMGAEIAVIYSRLPPHQLVSFIETMTGVRVEQLPEQSSEQADDDRDADCSSDDNDTDPEKENQRNAHPAYLDHSGQRLRDVAKRNAKKKHTITQGASSIHDRLKAQREEETRKKARSNRLLSSIGRGMTAGWGLW